MKNKVSAVSKTIHLFLIVNNAANSDAILVCYGNAILRSLVQQIDVVSNCSQTCLHGYHWDLIIIIHFGRVSTYLCFILYIASKRDRTNYIDLNGLST